MSVDELEHCVVLVILCADPDVADFALELERFQGIQPFRSLPPEVIPLMQLHEVDAIHPERAQAGFDRFADTCGRELFFERNVETPVPDVAGLDLGGDEGALPRPLLDSGTDDAFALAVISSCMY